LEMGLDSEPFSRKKGVPYTLRRRLSEVAEEYFVHRQERFELNAILPDTRRIEYIERKLKENGVRGKVIPPDDALAERREAMYREKAEGWVEEIIAEMLDTDELKNKVVEEFQECFKLQGARAWIETGFRRDDTQSWRDALKDTLQAAYEAKHKDTLKKAVRESIRKTVADDKRDNGEERT
jgi:hypothetical protein